MFLFLVDFVERRFIVKFGDIIEALQTLFVSFASKVELGGLD